MKNGSLIFTTSWDDGHPLDIRIADLLTKYDLRGTFYTPIRNNIENRRTMGPSDLRDLDKNFEIGGHTLDHIRLDSVDLNEAKRQVVEGKKRLEDDLGRGVQGFCYPGGNYNKSIIQIVANAGFNYARTTVNFHLSVLNDPFAMPATIQFYPHNRNVYMRNFIKHGHWSERARLFKTSLKTRNMVDRLKIMLDEAYKIGGVFHLWGHSWEIEEFGGWRMLEDYFCFASKLIENDKRLDNGSLFKMFYV